MLKDCIKLSKNSLVLCNLSLSPLCMLVFMYIECLVGDQSGLPLSCSNANSHDGEVLYIVSVYS